MPIKQKNFSKFYQKIYLIIRILTSIESFYFIYYENIFTIPSLLLGLITLSLIVLYIYNHKKGKWFSNEIRLYTIVLLSTLDLPFLFIASSRIAAKKKFFDETIIKIDSFLLGNYFPKGQLSLFLDEHQVFGPLTKFGKIINNILLVIYFSYYLIPYVFIFIVLFSKCIRETIHRFKNYGEKSLNYGNSWRELYFSLSVYNLTYIQILIINTIVPAISPRLYLKYEYKNNLLYLGLNKYIGNIKDDASANSFPSGHVGETFCLFLPFLFMKKYFIAFFILMDSLLISLSTLVLRYHYFSDVLMGMLNSIISFILVYFWINAFNKNKIKSELYEKIPLNDIYIFDENGEGKNKQNLNN